MQTPKLLVVLFSAASLLPSFGAELITNGNFEGAFSGGAPASWTYTQGDGPANLQNAANSPFTEVYPAGTKDLLFTDSGASNFGPNLIQMFPTQSGTIYASWDFNLDSLTGGEYWTVQIDDTTSASLRFDMDYTGGMFSYEADAVFKDVLALQADTWYHVALTLDIPTASFTGTITPDGGSPTAFGDNFRISTTVLGRFVFIDLSGNGQNAPIQLDNVSINTVPEPTSILLFGLGATVFLYGGFRRRKV